MPISTHSLTKRLTEIVRLSEECEKISTHSLTKRLTVVVDYAMEYTSISTHSLTKRLTMLTLYKKGLGIYFNSQPHEEADSHLMMIQLSICIFQLTASRRG